MNSLSDPRRAADPAAHLQRLQCSDLVLDTFPYGSHIQTEISFVPLYQDQAVLGDIDLQLRRPSCHMASQR